VRHHRRGRVYQRQSLRIQKPDLPYVYGSNVPVDRCGIESVEAQKDRSGHTQKYRIDPERTKEERLEENRQAQKIMSNVTTISPSAQLKQQ
jgi:hypothetical protein